MAACLPLAACGGGSGTSDTSPTPTASPTPTQTPTPTPTPSPTPGNQAPIAKAQSANTQQNTAISIQLDVFDPDNDITSTHIIEPPKSGQFNKTDGGWTYQPDRDFFGTDTLSYQVTDSEGAQSDVAQVTFNVTQQSTGRTIYVAVDGNNANSGSLQQPYKSLSYAVDQANAGDVILVRGGSYREHVKITNKQNLQIKAYEDEIVVISGTDIITSQWQPDNDRPGVYKTEFAANQIETDYTQVFVDGKFQQMARFPDNLNGKMMSPLDPKSGYALVTNAVKPEGASARSRVTFNQYGGIGPLPPVTFSDEAVIRGLIGKLRNNIFSASSDGANIQREDDQTVSFLGTNNGYWSQEAAYSLPEGFAYIFDLAVLDRPGEWFYSRNQNTLYYYPKTQNIEDLTIEIKTRKLALSVDNSNNIRLENLHIKAAAMSVDDSDGLIVDNCSFQFMHPFLYRRNYGVLKEGIVIDRSDAGIYKNNLIAHTWGSGIILNSGNNNTIHNNIIEDIGWLGQFTVAVFNEGENTQISQNTFGAAARFHIRTTAPVKSTIIDNHMYQAMSMGEDAGAIMMTSTGKTDYLDLKGTQIAYNHIHDISGIPAMDTKPNYNRQTVKAFYLEDVDNYSVHHNLVYNISGAGYQRHTAGTAVAADGSIIYLGPRTRSMTRPVNYYNNTFYNYDSFMNIWHLADNSNDIKGLISNGQFTNNLMVANKAHKLNGTYVKVTLPQHATTATGSISKIEKNSLAAYLAEIAKAPYFYHIEQSHNLEFSASESPQAYQNITQHDFRLRPEHSANSAGIPIEGITGGQPVELGAWEGDSLAEKERVFDAGAKLNKNEFPNYF
ncbi:Ig-like domain-containing protein [Gayadomonas joobiniege]|uniref:Ig-like domain-containing protein n=1 Tax=Gayadomonas joobiniege TaxID=1234606 RepID=UPI0018728E1A|nr:Ig-like domain-containing protein [Gayadomonas joobiniege]